MTALSLKASTRSMNWQSWAGPIRAFVCDWHRTVAKSGWLASCYLSGYFGPLSQCSGCATRRANRVIDEPRHRWPEIAFVPRSALVGVRTEIRLIPHLGKFDQAVLFKKRLDYETTVFCWLERNYRGQTRGSSASSLSSRRWGPSGGFWTI